MSMHRDEAGRSQRILRKQVLRPLSSADASNGNGDGINAVWHHGIFGLNESPRDALPTSLATVDPPCSHGQHEGMNAKLLSPSLQLSAADTTAQKEQEVIGNALDTRRGGGAALQLGRKLRTGSQDTVTSIQLEADALSKESTNSCKGAMEGNSIKHIATRSLESAKVIIRGPRSLLVGAVSSRRRRTCYGT
ncbi:uncharacterized protein LOC144124211 [Amblyomma americanum]